MKKEYLEPTITVISLIANKNIALIASDGDLIIDTDDLED